MIRFRKHLIIHLILTLFVLNSFSQDKVIISKINRTDPLYKQNIVVTLYDKNNDDTIQTFLTKDSLFIINNLDVSVYFIRFHSLIGTCFVKDLDLTFNDTIKISVNYPPIDCPFDKSIKKCPYGHRLRIKRIVYGYPSRFLMFKENLGLIHLGGCMISGCDPYHYCKKHNIDF